MRHYLIASILEENKHRGIATCANNYDACSKWVLQQSFFAKSLVFGSTDGWSAAICGEEMQTKILPIPSAQGAWTKGQFDMRSDTMRSF